MKYWLAKSEPDVFSIDDLKKKQRTYWDGVRNYQARNYLKEWKVGDLVLYYHSNAKPSGIVGIAEVSKEAVPDQTQFDVKSEYFDPKSTEEKPIWFSPEVRFFEKFSDIISLDELRLVKGLENLELLRKGSRLSVIPVSSKEFTIIQKLSTK